MSQYSQPDHCLNICRLRCSGQALRSLLHMLSICAKKCRQYSATHSRASSRFMCRGIRKPIVSSSRAAASVYGRASILRTHCTKDCRGRSTTRWRRKASSSPACSSCDGAVHGHDKRLARVARLLRRQHVLAVLPRVGGKVRQLDQPVEQAQRQTQQPADGGAQQVQQSAHVLNHLHRPRTSGACAAC